MTLSQHVEDRFSDWVDDELDAQERAAIEAHLAACASCRTSLQAFERSTQALRGLRLAPTPAAHVQAVQATVAGSRPPRLVPRVLSHAAAILIGVALMWSSRGCAGATDPKPTEIVREVRVEVPVEVRVEVPVEVVKEVRVEVPVEVEVVREVPVEVIEYVDRPVPTTPRLDVDRTYALLASIGSALEAIANATAAANALEVAPTEAIATADEPAPPPERLTAPLRVQRDGQRVRIHTRGTLEDVVPALIATLNDPDRDVARAVEQHLEALRAELANDPTLAPLGRRTAMVETDRPGGLRGLLTANDTEDELEVAPDVHARWSDWWHGRSSALAVAGND